MKETDLFELIHSVEAVTNEMVVQWTQAFGHKIGISPVLVLSELKKDGPLKQSALAAKLGYTAAAITNIAGKLVKEGLVERTADIQDRRTVRLTITEKGEDVLREAHLTGTRLRLEMFSTLSKEEVEQYLTINKKLLDALESGSK